MASAVATCCRCVRDNPLQNTFGKTVGQPGYNSQADFDNNNVVAAIDFTLLKSNFGTAGAAPLRPARGQGGDQAAALVPVGAGLAPEHPQQGASSSSASSASGARSANSEGSVAHEAATVPREPGVPPIADTGYSHAASIPIKSVIAAASTVQDRTGVNATAGGRNGKGLNSPNVVVVRTLVYLHSDQLGSISMVTSAAATPTVVSQQEFDPWGKVRSGGVRESKRNYTGQKLDDTGLLFYNARYYDPTLARFVSADSIVPGASSGVGGAGYTLGEVQNSILTVDFHEPSFVSSVSGENNQILRKGFWFQLSKGSQNNAKDPFGPRNPQALNRYAYVLNNPLRYVDPSGHIHCVGPFCTPGGVVVNTSSRLVYVTGDAWVDPNDHSKGMVTRTVAVEPGYSSADYGIADADFFSFEGSKDVTEIGDGVTATITDFYDPDTGQSGVDVDYSANVFDWLGDNLLSKGVHHTKGKAQAYNERYRNSGRSAQDIEREARGYKPLPGAKRRPVMPPCPGPKCVS